MPDQMRKSDIIMEEYTTSNSREYPQLQLPYTIEQQLYAYSVHKNATDRHKILWHAWNQNKGWLSRFLELTLPSFPTYSRHDATHAQTVLHNIELVLGADRIRQLSPTDCFLILHVTYVHDIGMCITAQDRKDAVRSDEFIELINSCEHSDDITKTKWAACMKQFRYDYMENVSKERENDALRQLYEDKLEIYHAIINLLTEYIRSRHGERSKERLLQWTTDKEKLGAGFAFSGIPNRIFSRMAECAGLHTVWQFESILELPREDSGYAHDCIHPRFVAVLLQLGDALDLDNDRFHPFVLDMVGQLPGTSKLHFEKHNAIRMLQITPNEINISADCGNVTVLHMIRKECGWIEDLLKNASYHWPKIVPNDFSGCLPSMNRPVLQLNGTNIPQELVTARFSISQEKAFQLLEGSNVYSDYFPFLRELLQNALDATKIQYWSTYQGSAGYQRKIQQDQKFHESTFSISRRMPLTDYPIEIFFKIQAVDVRGEEVTPDFIAANPEQVDYGVLLEIQDHGTGMTQKDIIEISSVGTSHSKRHEYVREMPDALKPTGEFGIGLQSVFMITSQFECDTRAYNGEAYHIVFSEASRQNDGIINAAPLLNQGSFQFGTKFKVFVSRKYKVDHHKFLQAWAGIDYFAADYENLHRLHEAEELMAQMIYYLQEILGEQLFPVCVVAEDPFSEELPYNLQNLQSDVSKFILSISTKKKGSEPVLNDENLRTTLSWGFKEQQDLIVQKERQYRMMLQMDWDYEQHKKFRNATCPKLDAIMDQERKFYENENIYGIIPLARNKFKKDPRYSEDRYYLDPVEWKLYIWCEEVRTFACLSADRFMEKYYQTGDTNGEAKLYYKGIKLHSTANFSGDLDLIEYLDIKHGNARQCLQLNRDQLTEEGWRYLQENICTSVLKSAYAAMKYIANKIRKQEHDNTSNFLDDIDTCLQKRLEMITLDSHPSFIRSVGKSLLSLTLLSYYAKANFATENDVPCVGEGNPVFQNCPWEKLMMILDEHMKRLKDKCDSDASGTLAKNLEFLFVQQYGENSEQYDTLNIASLLSNKQRYYIYSTRQHRQAPWQHQIISAIPPTRVYEREHLKNKKNEPILEKEMDNTLKQLVRTANTYLSGKNSEPYLSTKYSDYVAKWMLRNIATEKVMAHMSRRMDTGNIRLNLLTTNQVHEISFNNEMLYLLLKKMDERNRIYNAQRFSTVVWSGLSCLQVNTMPSTVCQINRGYFSEAAKPQMLLPLRAKDIHTFLHLFETRTSEENESTIGRLGAGLQENSEEYVEPAYLPRWKTDSAFTSKINNIIKTVKDFMDQVLLDKNLRMAYDRVVESYADEMRKKNTREDLLALELPTRDPEWEKKLETYRRDNHYKFNNDETDILDEPVNSDNAENLKNQLETIQNSPEFHSYAKLSAWLQFGLMRLLENVYLQDRCLDQLKRPLYDRNAVLEKELENMIFYIQQNGTQHPSRDRIIVLFLEIYDRLAEAVKAIHRKEFISYIREECGYVFPIDKL